MTLEAIKLFLSVPKMAFVIAADEALVRAAIAQHFDASQQEVGWPATTSRRSSRSRSRSLPSGRATPRPSIGVER
jgi:hypothetical protein